MHSVLLVKTSSLGDVVHNLPIVHDIREARADILIDWVVEASFAPVTSAHLGIRRVIPCKLRHWRRNWYTAQTRAEWRAFLAQLRLQSYDAIIDTQGLLKSAVITRLAVGPKYGLDWRSSREPLRLFYDSTFSVPRSMHAVERNRRLCGLALGYEPSGPPDYGTRCAPSNAQWLPQQPFLVFLHATSHPRKLWPVAHWVELGAWAAKRGFAVVLPWGSEPERERARTIASQLPGAVVPQRLPLGELASVLVTARGAVGVDTGLTHLAAALGVPMVGIYGATDPSATGVLTQSPAKNLGGPNGFPRVQDVVGALQELHVVADEPTMRQRP